MRIESDGSFAYVPDEDYVGRDGFSYQVTDGEAISPFATVVIDVVARPVSIRLEAVDSNNNPVTEVVADEPIVVRTAVQDLRSASEAELGLGAAYLDIAYNVDFITPVTSQDGPLGLAVQFGPAYPNGIDGELLPEGRLNDIGAFQAGFQPLGGEEIELFRINFDMNGPRAVDDSYQVARGAAVNRLDVLRNESDVRWDVTLDAQHAANSPIADVAYLDPAEPVPEDDIRYGDITLAVRNGELTIRSVSETASGATVSFDSEGIIFYEPVQGFTGQDSFTYSVVDGLGRVATATVTIEVNESWQNSLRPTDVNGDGTDSPLDALVIVNELNEMGAHELADGLITAFLDVNGDGIVSPIDALVVINRLLEKTFLGEGELAASDPEPQNLAINFVPTSTRFATAAPVPEVIFASTTRPPSATDQAARVFGQALPAIPRSNRGSGHGFSAELDDEPLSDLLDTFTEDIAALWADYP